MAFPANKDGTLKLEGAGESAVLQSWYSPLLTAEIPEEEGYHQFSRVDGKYFLCTDLIHDLILIQFGICAAECIEAD